METDEKRAVETGWNERMNKKARSLMNRYKSGVKRKESSVLISDPRESECRHTERRTTECEKERRRTLIGLLFAWCAGDEERGAECGLGRRFRSISGSLYGGVTERRREEGSAGSRRRGTWE